MDANRRLVNYSLLALVGSGGYFTTGTIFKALEPPKFALKSAATVINTKELETDEVGVFSWLKKPIFVCKQNLSGSIDLKREVQIGSYAYTIMIGICTHLGCIPKYDKSTKTFICPCHNGIFDIHGYPISGPVSKPLVIPPFTIQDETIIVGEEGEAYLRLFEDRV